jgi:hypothetical protein
VRCHLLSYQPIPAQRRCAICGSGSLRCQSGMLFRRRSALTLTFQNCANAYPCAEIALLFESQIPFLKSLRFSIVCRCHGIERSAGLNDHRDAAVLETPPRTSSAHRDVSIALPHRRCAASLILKGV